jgi:hypothetical protein
MLDAEWEFFAWRMYVRSTADLYAQQLFGSDLPKIEALLAPQIKTGKRLMKSGFENAIWHLRDRCLNERDPGYGLAIHFWVMQGEVMRAADCCEPLNAEAIGKAIRKCLRFQFWFAGASVWGDAALAYVRTHTLGILTYNTETRLWKEYDDEKTWISAEPDEVHRSPNPVIVVRDPRQRTGIVWADFFDFKTWKEQKVGACQRKYELPVCDQLDLVCFLRGGFEATDLNTLVDEHDAIFFVPFDSLYRSQKHYSEKGTHDGWRLNYNWQIRQKGEYFAEFHDNRCLGPLSCSIRFKLYFDPER